MEARRQVRGRKRLNGRGGAILLMVLVLIVVVTFTLTIFIERAEVEIKGEGYYVKRSELRLEAWSMLEVAVATLADVKGIEGTLYAESQGWGNPLEYCRIAPREGLEVRYEFIDESGKMNLNAMGEDSLILLFNELGFDIDVGLRMTSVLLDWIDADDETRIDGAESREYSSLELKSSPANRPLRALEELKYLFVFKDLFFNENGLPLPVFERLAEATTVFDVGQLNVNSASPLALRAMADMDDMDVSLIDSFLKGLDGIKGTADDNFFANRDDLAAVLGEVPAGANLANQISVLTVKVTVAESGYSYTLVGTMNLQAEAPALEESGGNLRYPFLFLELRELAGANNARPM